MEKKRSRMPMNPLTRLVEHGPMEIVNAFSEEKVTLGCTFSVRVLDDPEGNRTWNFIMTIRWDNSTLDPRYVQYLRRKMDVVSHFGGAYQNGVPINPFMLYMYNRYNLYYGALDTSPPSDDNSLTLHMRNMVMQKKATPFSSIKQQAATFASYVCKHVFEDTQKMYRLQRDHCCNESWWLQHETETEDVLVLPTFRHMTIFKYPRIDVPLISNRRQWLNTDLKVPGFFQPDRLSQLVDSGPMQIINEFLEEKVIFPCVFEIRLVADKITGMHAWNFKLLTLEKQCRPRADLSYIECLHGILRHLTVKSKSNPLVRHLNKTYEKVSYDIRYQNDYEYEVNVFTKGWHRKGLVKKQAATMASYFFQHLFNEDHPMYRLQHDDCCKETWWLELFRPEEEIKVFKTSATEDVRYYYQIIEIPLIRHRKKWLSKNLYVADDGPALGRRTITNGGQQKQDGSDSSGGSDAEAQARTPGKAGEGHPRRV